MKQTLVKPEFVLTAGQQATQPGELHALPHPALQRPSVRGRGVITPLLPTSPLQVQLLQHFSQN